MGQKPHSKRKRKQAAQNSLKYKQTAHQGFDDAQTPLPSSEHADTNTLFLPPTSGVQTSAAKPVPKGPKLSKSQLKKQKKVQEELKKREQRSQVYESLKQHSLSDAHHALIMPAHMLGQSETKRQQLRRALHHQRAGIALPEGSRLEQERQQTAMPAPSATHEIPATAPHAVTARIPLQASDSSPESASGSEAEASAEIPSNKRRKLQQSPQPDASAQAEAQPMQDAVDEPQQLQAARLVAAAVKQDLGIAANEDAPAELPDQPSLAGACTRVRHVRRRPDIEAVRVELPITGMEQEIMESILQNDVVVLCGETGCGKTTQVPQFLYEAGYGCSDYPERAGMIGVTQPRRVAAISTATRVADELNSKLGTLVGYQVRYDRKVNKDTALKFMTDGILLRELQEDFLLTKYSSIVIDEAHERSLNTDLLLGLLSRVVPLRRSMSLEANSGVHPLKLMIMSATLRIEDFTGNRRLFPTAPPLVHVPARQYPVTVHFNRRTELEDYVGAAFQKVCKIHRELPPGGILVFLTGQREVEFLCKRLQAAFVPRRSFHKAAPGKAGKAVDSQAVKEQESQAEQADLDELYGGDAAEVAGDAAAAAESDDDAEVWSEDDMDSEEEDLLVMGGEGFTPEELAHAEQNFTKLFASQTSVQHQAPNSIASHPGSTDSTVAPADGPKALADGKGPTKSSHGAPENDSTALRTGQTALESRQNASDSCHAASSKAQQGPGPVQVLPLYANLPKAAQAQVFQTPPAGHRLIVVATNVAETSLTIPGIRYVVDAGRSKQKILAEGGALAEYAVRWISKASAQQRAGRSGRTGPGHCYRLFSSAHFNDTFPEHTPPEILNTSLEGLVLLMKAMHVDKVVHFPFPTSPEAEALKAAQTCLVALSALHPPSFPTTPLGLTNLGRAMSAYPITPRHAKMLLQAALQGKSGKKGPGIVAYAVALAAALSVESPFIHADNITGGGEEEEQKRRRQSARGYQKRFVSSHGDAITALNVLCAYQQAEDQHAFCRQHYLHERNLKEMVALQSQLSRAVAQRPPSHQPGLEGSNVAGSSNQSVGSSSSNEASRNGRDGAGLMQRPYSPAADPLSAPSLFVVHELRKAITAGWVDQVARRVKAREQVDDEEEGRKGKRAVRYQACSRPGFVFLHPRSSLHSTAPDFVVYTQLISTAKRPYMAGVTAIEASWLAEAGNPLCAWSGPLPDPPPSYQPESDAVQCWQHVSFGSHSWPLPVMLTDIQDPKARTAAFAVALLEGKVLPILAGLQKAWVMPPRMAARQDVREQHQLDELATQLDKHSIDSKASLASAWQASPLLLKQEVSQWLQKRHRKVLDALWPKLLSQAAEH